MPWSDRAPLSNPSSSTRLFVLADAELSPSTCLPLKFDTASHRWQRSLRLELFAGYIEVYLSRPQEYLLSVAIHLMTFVFLPELHPGRFDTLR
jgi:hypothetical protein